MAVHDVYEVLLYGTRICGEPSEDDVVPQVQLSARISEILCLDACEPLNSGRTMGVDGQSGGRIEIQHSPLQTVHTDLVQRVVGQRTGDPVNLEVPKDEVVVEHRVPGVVEPQVCGLRRPDQFHGEEDQRRPDGECFTGKASLHEGITDVQVVAPLLPGDPVDVPVQLGELGEVVRFPPLRGLRIRSRELHPLGAVPENLQRIAEVRYLHQIECLLGIGGAGHEQQPVAPADVHQFLLQFLEGALHLSAHADTLVILGFRGIVVEDGEELLGIVPDEHLAQTLDQTEVRDLPRKYRSHL